MEFLSTGFALLILGACAFMLWRCHEYAEDAVDAMRSLSKSQGKLASHDLLLSALHQSVKRIDGKVGALQARLRAPLSSADGDADFPAHDEYSQRQRGIDRPNSGDVDPELAAELALQNAPAVSPGKRS